MHLSGLAHVVLHRVIKGREPNVLPHICFLSHRFEIKRQIKMSVAEVVSLLVREKVVFVRSRCREDILNGTISRKECMDILHRN